MSKGTSKSKNDLYQYSNYRDFLNAEYYRRKTENKRFSLGAWAKRLDLKGNSALVMILNGQRHPGPNLVEKINDDLQFNSKEKSYFRDLVLYEKCRVDRAQLKENILKRLEQANPRKQFRELTRGQFEVIAEWHHYAIRELADLPDFKEDPYWIQSRLKTFVSIKAIQQALENLVKLGLLIRDENNLLKYANKIVSQLDIPDPALKQFHESMLNQALISLKSDSVTEREISGMTFTVAQKNIEQAKQLIKNLYIEMTQLGPETQDSVYHLEVALFPVTITKEKNL